MSIFLSFFHVFLFECVPGLYHCIVHGVNIEIKPLPCPGLHGFLGAAEDSAFPDGNQLFSFATNNRILIFLWNVPRKLFCGVELISTFFAAWQTQIACEAITSGVVHSQVLPQWKEQMHWQWTLNGCNVCSINQGNNNFSVYCHKRFLLLKAHSRNCSLVKLYFWEKVWLIHTFEDQATRDGGCKHRKFSYRCSSVTSSGKEKRSCSDILLLIC